MIVIRFNQWDEFVEELKSDPPDNGVVRVTVSLRYNGGRTPHLTLVAGYFGGDQIVEFVHYLGQRRLEDDGARSRELAALVEERKRCLEHHGFKVRSGRYHVPALVHQRSDIPQQ
jgi:hypothetical protein